VNAFNLVVDAVTDETIKWPLSYPTADKKAD